MSPEFLASTRPSGLVWLGSIYSLEGYGSVARNYLVGLKRMRYPCRAINLGPDHRDAIDPSIVRDIETMEMTDVGPHPALVIHDLPPSFRHIQTQNFVRRIGCFLFETDRLPDGWAQECEFVDEVWVPSQFNRLTFAQAGVPLEKIRVVPYGVNTEFFHPRSEKAQLPQAPGFRFLYVSHFDYRKGFDLLLRAFLEEFRGSKNVSLIIKTGFQPGHGFNEPQGLDPKRSLARLLGLETEMLAKDAPNVVVITDNLSQERLRALYRACNLYISTDRANGWGMPCMEAMAAGVPAACIAWSGATDFMTKRNSLLIRPTGKLVPVDPRLEAARPIYLGHRWAEVTVEEVRRVLRQAVSHPFRLWIRGRLGRRHVRKNLSHVEAARFVITRMSGLTIPSGPTTRPRILMGAREFF